MTRPTGNPRGRPAKPDDERADTFPLRLTGSQRAAYEADAIELGVSLTDWLRDAAERKLKARKRVRR